MSATPNMNGDVVSLGLRQSRPLAQSMMVTEEGGPKFGVLKTMAAICAVLVLAGWIALIPLDEVAGTSGEIVPGAEARNVSHREGGVISEILVADGDIVDAGQDLIRLDDKEIRNSLQEMETRHAKLTMLAAQLKALGRGESPDFTFALPKFRKAVDNELLIFASLKKLTEKRERVLGELVTATQLKLKNITQQEQELSNKSVLLEEELLLRQDLFKKGLTPKTVFQEAKKLVERAHLDLADLARARKSTARVLDTAKKRAAEIQSRLRERVFDELTVLTKELDGLAEELKVQSARLDRLTITAPVNGIVKGAQRHSLGNVMASGAVIMELIPLSGMFFIETRILPVDKERVSAGQPVSVRVRALGFNEYSAMPGTLKEVSPSTFSDARGREYYKGIIELKRLPAAPGSVEARLLPGMAIEADIKTGSRKLFQTILN